jgi:Mrp family chromosome partitioning ATPase
VAAAERETDMAKTETIRGLERGLRVLQFLQTHPIASLSQLHAGTKFSKPSLLKAISRLADVDDKMKRSSTDTRFTMELLVHELKHRYNDRYIIFDSTPLLVTADPLMLGMHMDGVVFVVQEGRTSQQAALQSMSLMKGWNVLGVVFNNVPEYLVKGHYQYYYRQPSDKKQSNTHEETI